MKGKYSMHDTCSNRETSQKLQLHGSLPSWGRGSQSHTGNSPRPLSGVMWEDIQSQGDLGFIPTISSTSIVAVPNTNLESARERKGLYVPK